MAAITGAQNLIEVAPVEAAKGGILSVATIVDDPDVHSLLGAEYETEACIDARSWTQFCTQPNVNWPAHVASVTGSKVFDQGATLVSGNPFIVYAGKSCDIQRVDDAEKAVIARLAYNERRQVDAAVQTALAAVDVSLGALQTSLAKAVGALELYAANEYGGVPTIVMPADAVAAAGDLIVRELDGRLTTRQGTPVANTADPARAPLANPATIYVTGRILLLRGPVNSFSVPPMHTAAGVTVNARALAERVYVPLVECIVGSLTVTL
jgi:hypothetical protein